MEPLTLVALLVAAAAVAVAAVAVSRGAASAERADELAALLERTSEAVAELARRQATDAASTRASVDAAARESSQVTARMDALRNDVAVQLGATRDTLDRKLDGIGRNVGEQLSQIRADNGAQLERMRATVDEKLSRTLSDRLSTSFSQISRQLEAVDRGLGEMRGLASGVGDLKRVLSNVKTRGMLGEVQLGAILSEVLAPEQYEEQACVRPGSAERVDFAVRLPVEEGDPVLLPIDAKFPGDTYLALREASDQGDPDAVAAARARLETTIRTEAKSISEKYVCVPQTTNFAIMFLPFEGLYAEVVGMPGLVEALQRDYRVNVAGPSTMAALLNSLQLSYQTFRLQRRTDEVLRTLQAVKAELPKYQDALKKAKAQIDRASGTVEKIITTRTNVMERKLAGIALDDEEGLPAADDADAADDLDLSDEGPAED